MAQLFTARANLYARVLIMAAVLFLGGAGWLVWVVTWSPYVTDVGLPVEQPLPFSHKQHVADVGIDCRYCHTTAEESAFAGMPSSQTCMACHAQVLADVPSLAALQQDRPLQWNRVNDLPDYTYFDHSIHVAKGIGCSTCHGRVDEMPRTYKIETLYMKWCLDCHRDPTRFVRPADKIYDMSWQSNKDRHVNSASLIEQYHIDTSGRLSDCSTCHR